MLITPLFFLAEDDDDDRLLFSEALAEIDSGIKCVMAKNGEEALLLLQQQLGKLPDYIFLDLNMPVMNGLKCLREIKTIPVIRNIPVILYSTSADNRFIEESKALGAADFFVKPPNFSGLIQYLSKLLKPAFI